MGSTTEMGCALAQPAREHLADPPRPALGVEELHHDADVLRRGLNLFGGRHAFRRDDVCSMPMLGCVRPREYRV